MSSLIMHNSEHLELWPSCLLDAQGRMPVPDLTRWSLRDKASGQFFAHYAPDSGWTVSDLIADAKAPHAVIESALAHEPPRRPTGESTVDASGLVARLAALNLDADAYTAQTGLPLIAEPQTLHFANFDRYGRTLWLTRDAANAWFALRLAAARDEIPLEAISGFRSHWYQLGIFERKVAKGQTISDILTVNAAPGFSEHHSGTALDISAPGEPACEESFESTRAFEWLCANAQAHGFVMSYPRDNPHGITYEPWHWRFEPRERLAFSV